MMEPIRLQSLNPETPDAYWEVGMIEDDGQGHKIAPEIGVRFAGGPWIAFGVLRETVEQFEDLQRGHAIIINDR